MNYSVVGEEKRAKKCEDGRGSHLIAQKEALLKGSKPYTYFISRSELENQFLIIWMQPDGVIADAVFEYLPEQKGWFYRNATWCPHHEQFEDLLAHVFHCSRDLLPHSGLNYPV